MIKALLTCMLVGLLFVARGAAADSVPELLHYRFDGTGPSVPNLASSPPAGTENATIMGALTQAGPDLGYLQQGHSLVGSGNSSENDYLNTGWATALPGSWTISFVTQDIGPSGTLFYIFGDVNAGSFRCFTNGVAGPNNWILRGTNMTDVLVNGGATTGRHRTTFVYDQAANTIHGYLDGVLVTSVVQGSTPVISGTGPFKVMGYSSNVGAPANGLLDDFRIYDRALSAAEVEGIDTHAVIAVSGNGQAITHDDTTPDSADGTDFGEVPLADDPVEHQFLVENTGNLPLTITGATLSGATPGDFSVVTPTDPIPPGDSAPLLVHFDPQAAGASSATVTLASDAGNHPAFNFDVAGTGTSPTIVVTGNGQPIANGDTTPDATDHTDFGHVVIGGPSTSRSFLIINEGNAALTVGSVVITGPAAAEFTLSQGPAGTVAPGTDTAFDIAFAPVGHGARRATVTIASDAPGNEVYTFDLEGIGDGADVQVSKTNFQSHLLSGIDTVYTVQVLNAGPASVSSVRIVDTLPANLLDGAWQCVSEPDGLCPNASGGPDIDETTGPLASGALLEYTLVATPDGEPSDFVTNTATAENLDGNDPDTLNNSATDSDPIVPEGIFGDGFESTGKALLRERIGA